MESNPNDILHAVFKSLEDHLTKNMPGMHIVDDTASVRHSLPDIFLDKHIHHLSVLDPKGNKIAEITNKEDKILIHRIVAGATHQLPPLNNYSPLPRYQIGDNIDQIHLSDPELHNKILKLIYHN